MSDAARELAALRLKLGETEERARVAMIAATESAQAAVTLLDRIQLMQAVVDAAVEYVIRHKDSAYEPMEKAVRAYEAGKPS